MLQRDNLKVYKIYTKDKKEYEITAKCFTERINGIVFWDTTGNVEIGFVPISSLNFIKVIGFQVEEYNAL